VQHRGRGDDGTPASSFSRSTRSCAAGCGTAGRGCGGAPPWLILGEIRAPRTLGACAGPARCWAWRALAQGLFRNPLADPYLLGSAAGAGLAVVLVLARRGLAGTDEPGRGAGWCGSA
jgi:ABC-type enterobactin transport system permease subunit